MILNAFYSLFSITHMIRLLLNLKNETAGIEIAVETAVGGGEQVRNPDKNECQK